VPETPREVAFCAYAINDTLPLVVADALLDERFVDNPDVLGGPKIRFYAGAPLVTQEGFALGTLCVIDRVPRQIAPEQLRALQILSRQAVAQLELRRRLDELHGAYVDLQEFDRLRDAFVSMVSHELRTPLTSIDGGLQLVLHDPDVALGDEHRQLLSVARTSAARLIRLTRDILDVSKIESGMLELRLAPCAIADVVADASAAVEYMPGARGRIAARVPPGLPSLTVDHDRLVQALVNLMGNALKFSPPSASVIVAVAAHADRVEIAVKDDGPGIGEADQAKLFTPFRQFGSGSRAGGTGLGLAITKAIVEQHRGSILVTSAEGRGTTFTVLLPLG
jgi:signal transduction histidine kinase